MDETQQYEEELEVYLRKFPVLNTVSSILSIPKTYLFVYGWTFLFLILFWRPGGEIVSNLLGFMYPSYLSLQLLQNNKMDVKLIISYWCSWFLINLLEYFLTMLPLYYLIKTGFFLWLLIPHYNGAQVILDSILHPCFLMVENIINDDGTIVTNEDVQHEKETCQAISNVAEIKTDDEHKPKENNEKLNDNKLDHKAESSNHNQNLNDTADEGILHKSPDSKDMNHDKSPESNETSINHKENSNETTNQAHRNELSTNEVHLNEAPKSNGTSNNRKENSNKPTNQVHNNELSTNEVHLNGTPKSKDVHHEEPPNKENTSEVTHDKSSTEFNLSNMIEHRNESSNELTNELLRNESLNKSESPKDTDDHHDKSSKKENTSEITHDESSTEFNNNLSNISEDKNESTNEVHHNEIKPNKLHRTSTTDNQINNKPEIRHDNLSSTSEPLNRSELSQNVTMKRLPSVSILINRNPSSSGPNYLDSNRDDPSQSNLPTKKSNITSTSLDTNLNYQLPNNVTIKQLNTKPYMGRRKSLSQVQIKL